MSEKKRPSVGKKWCFTLNNWCEEHLVKMVKDFEVFGLEYIIGEEVGESGTPHLQGAVFGEKYFRPMEAFKWEFKPHWEKCKGNKEQNVAYCKKQGTFHTNMKVPKPLFCPEIYGWQLEAASLISSEPDPSDRTIHWWWEPYGGVGKSDLVRWLVIKKNAIVCAGKAADMKHMIVAHTEQNNGVWPELIVFDVPRSQEGYLSYTGIEEIKNGIFASSKYESSMFKMNRPHVMVFANFEPTPGRDMSADRFRIVRINDRRDIMDFVIDA